MPKVFVSYARADSRKVNRITKRLTAHGLEFWMDTHKLEGGDDWSEKIIKAINGCDKFLLFMSVVSMASDNVEREVHAAFKKKKKIILLRLDNARVPLSLDYQLGRIQWIDYLSSNWEAKTIAALGGGKKFFQPPRTKPERPLPAPASRTRPIPKKAPKAQLVANGLIRAFSGNGRYHIDQCEAALAQLDDLSIVVTSHWINPSLAFKEQVPRQFLLDKIEIVRSLIQDFQATCPPGSSNKRHLILDELRLLSQELARTAKP